VAPAPRRAPRRPRRPSLATPAVRFGGPPGSSDSDERCDARSRSWSSSPAARLRRLANVSAFAFDADGRLWAATAAYDDQGSDAVYLIATPGATPVKVIADLHTPLGLLWSGGTLYLASAGRVDAYSGLAEAAFARHTTVLALPLGVGEVNGLVMSPDGRLVLGVSAPCDACTTTSEDAAAIISFLPDGRDLRVVASGIRAPVGLAYYPGTDDLVTDGLGSSVTSSALVAEWATGKVLRVALTGEGSGYTGVVEPFLPGLTKPVPVATAPDGAVLVGDWGTGTVYRIAAG